MTAATNALEQQALDWVIRLRHASADDWVAFDAWLDEDVARAEAYWRFAAADASVAEALSQPLPSAEVIPLSPRGHRRWLLLPIAASLAIAVGIYWATMHGKTPRAPQTYAIETPPGESREAMLPDGTRVALNGGTRIELDRAEPRAVRLVRGEVRFDVVHNSSDPFVVNAGDASLRDIGTVFDVTRDQAVVRVAVAEGAVLYEEKATSRRLGAGDSLIRDTSGMIQAARVDPADVGAWRERRLVYDRTRVSLVAADLARATGTTVSVDPAIASRLFSGGLRVGKDPGETIARAADLIGVQARRDGAGWRLAER